MAPKADAREKLDKYGIDAVCDWISGGESMTTIAGKAGVSIGSMLTWLNADPERSARAKEARIGTAKYWDEKAEVGIAEASDPFELSKAKELAHHYRWRASKIAPKDYGDKLELAGEIGVNRLTDEQVDARLAALLAKAQGEKVSQE